MHRKGITLLVIFLLGINCSQGQQVRPEGTFSERETKIGQELNFSLWVRYNRSLNILFPDSTFDFGTFEYVSRRYFPTKTDSTQSFDSVVYQLATFEIDSIQYLQLPVFIINNKDSLTALSSIDSVRLVQVVKDIPEKPEMKTNTELVKIKRQFNYPYLLIALAALAIIGFSLLLFFGKQLQRAWKIYRMKKVHQKFLEQFYQLIRDVSSNNPSNTPEHVLAVWKRYLERLEKKPISKLTTKEILVLHNNGDLKDNLKKIDRSIYGNEKGNDLFASFDYLMKFSIDIYQHKINEIKNA